MLDKIREFEKSVIKDRERFRFEIDLGGYIGLLLSNKMEKKDLLNYINETVDKIFPNEDDPRASLVYDAVHAIEDNTSDEHLKYLQSCLSKEKDYSKASLIQKKFDSYAEARSKLDEILEDNSINTREVESSLSPDKPVEFLILHAFDYARKNGVISGILNGAIDKIVFNEDSDVFVRKVLEVLGGERSYTLRITHSKEGKVYSSVEIN